MGPWGIATLIAIATILTETGRSSLRKIVRTGLRAGYHAKESINEFADKAKGYKDELIAEIKAEEVDETSDNHKKKKEKEKAATHHAE